MKFATSKHRNSYEIWGLQSGTLKCWYEFTYFQTRKSIWTFALPMRKRFTGELLCLFEVGYSEAGNFTWNWRLWNRQFSYDTGSFQTGKFQCSYAIGHFQAGISYEICLVQSGKFTCAAAYVSGYFQSGNYIWNWAFPKREFHMKSGTCKQWRFSYVHIKLNMLKTQLSKFSMPLKAPKWQIYATFRSFQPKASNISVACASDMVLEKRRVGQSTLWESILSRTLWFYLQRGSVVTGAVVAVTVEMPAGTGMVAPRTGGSLPLRFHCPLLPYPQHIYDSNQSRWASYRKIFHPAEAVTFDRCACIDTFLENLRRRFLQETIRSNSEEFEWIPEEKIIPEDPAESPPPDCRLAGGYLGNYVRGISQDLGLSATAV